MWQTRSRSPAARAGPASRPARLQTNVRTTARGGLELFSPRDRNPGPALGLTAFWVIWSGAVWLQVALKVPLVFPVIFGLFDVLLLVLVLGLWFGTSRITCEENRLTVRNVLLGLGVRRAAGFADVTAIETPITMQSGGGSGTPYYGIRFRCRDGRTISANFEIRDKQEVEWLVAQLQRAVGLREPSAQ